MAEFVRAGHGEAGVVVSGENSVRGERKIVHPPADPAVDEGENDNGKQKAAAHRHKDVGDQAFRKIRHLPRNVLPDRHGAEHLAAFAVAMVAGGVVHNGRGLHIVRFARDGQHLPLGGLAPQGASVHLPRAGVIERVHGLA